MSSLALKVGQAGEKVPYPANTLKPTLEQLFYFYENSSVRMSGLKVMEQILQLCELKLERLQTPSGFLIKWVV